MITDDTERFTKEIFEDKVYEFNPKYVVIDVGANVGLYSEYIYDRAKVIYAIEPSTKNYQLLLNRIKDKNLTKIKPFNIGLANRTIETPLYKRSSNGGYSIMATGNDEIEEMVSITTLAMFMGGNNINYVDILKVDVEGAEYDIFNSDDLSSVQGKIGNIIGEPHGGISIKELLEANGFSYRLNDSGIFIAERIV